jgi:hypothetical protein
VSVGRENRQPSFGRETKVRLEGGVAQLGERLPCTQEVIGSSPFTSTILPRRMRQLGFLQSAVLNCVVL